MLTECRNLCVTDHECALGLPSQSRYIILYSMQFSPQARFKAWQEGIVLDVAVTTSKSLDSPSFPCQRKFCNEGLLGLHALRICMLGGTLCGPLLYSCCANFEHIQELSYYTCTCMGPVVIRMQTSPLDQDVAYTPCWQMFWWRKLNWLCTGRNIKE